MKTRHVFRFGVIAGVFLMLLVLPPLLQTAQAQVVSPSDTAGALLWREQQRFYLQRTQPYLIRPIEPGDVNAPESQTPTIHYEEGVLPEHQNSVQGILVTPQGKIYIGPQ